MLTINNGTPQSTTASETLYKQMVSDAVQSDQPHGAVQEEIPSHDYSSYCLGLFFRLQLEQKSSDWRCPK